MALHMYKPVPFEKRILNVEPQFDAKAVGKATLIILCTYAKGVTILQK